jgi:threonine/homoserine/homoserine lactone efflux protein
MADLFCCGCLMWGLAVSLGLGTLLAASHFAYTTLRIAGAMGTGQAEQQE